MKAGVGFRCLVSFEWWVPPGRPVSAHLIPQIGECVPAFVAVASLGLSEGGPHVPNGVPPANVAFRSHCVGPQSKGGRVLDSIRGGRDVKLHAEC